MNQTNVNVPVKPVVEASSIEKGSVSSIIANVSDALRSEGRIGDIREMTIKCMESNDFNQCIEIIKNYVVIV